MDSIFMWLILAILLGFGIWLLYNSIHFFVIATGFRKGKCIKTYAYRTRIKQEKNVKVSSGRYSSKSYRDYTTVTYAYVVNGKRYTFEENYKFKKDDPPVSIKIKYLIRDPAEYLKDGGFNTNYFLAVVLLDFSILFFVFAGLFIYHY